MDIIKVKNEGYDRYEELLLLKDRYKKEASQWQMEYSHVFGDLIIAAFQKKIDCIKRKKLIVYYQKAINRGEAISQEELELFLAKEMEEYSKRLRQMIDENNSALLSSTVSPSEYSRIKMLYYRLAKRLHPDINPKTNEIKELKGLWLMVLSAYNANNLEELEEAEVFINHALKRLGLDGDVVLNIVDIESKIAAPEEDIERIRTSEPYMYKYLLSDEEYVKGKRKELVAEKEEWEAYEKELDKGSF